MVRKIYTAGSIKLCEETAFADGISADDLMYKAGCSVADELARHTDVRRKNILILCGSGNNGGDGFVCAKKLSEMSAFPYVCVVMGKPKTKQAKNAFRLMPEEVTVITEKQVFSDINEYDIIIDAVFGFGFHGALDESLQKLMETINGTDAVRVAVDVPSGAECDTGHIKGACFKADMTVTFTAEKPFCYLYPAREYAGVIRVKDVGIPRKYTEAMTPYAYVFENRDAVSDLPLRIKNSNKGTFGSLLCATGSETMMGAAVLRSRARLRSGIGLCYQICSKNVYPAFLSAVPEAVCTDLRSSGPYFQKAKAILCGCGIGITENSKSILGMCLESNKPLVLDADALNILAESDYLNITCSENTVMTPHPAEAARLLGITVKDILEDRFKAAQDLCEKYECTVLLKGANTVIEKKNQIPVIIPCTNSGLAKGGSGDALAGIIGALVAQNIDVFKRTCLGAYIHAQAGEICHNIIGEYSMQPSDIINALPQVFKHLYEAKPVRNYFTKE